MTKHLRLGLPYLSAGGVAHTQALHRIHGFLHEMVSLISWTSRQLCSQKLLGDRHLAPSKLSSLIIILLTSLHSMFALSGKEECRPILHVLDIARLLHISKCDDGKVRIGPSHILPRLGMWDWLLALV